MDQLTAPEGSPSGHEPVSVHFVNNVLAAAASLIEDEPDEAREVLALLSQFLTYRLRAPDGPVPVAAELDHVSTYLRLEQARFPGRIELELPAASELPEAHVARAAVQAPVAAGLGRRLSARSGPCRLVLRVRPGRPELDLEVATLGAQHDETEHVRIPLEGRAVAPA